MLFKSFCFVLQKEQTENGDRVVQINCVLVEWISIQLTSSVPNLTTSVG